MSSKLAHKILGLLFFSLGRAGHLAMTEVAEQVPTDPELLFQLRSSATHLAGKPWEGAGS